MTNSIIALFDGHLNLLATITPSAYHLEPMYYAKKNHLRTSVFQVIERIREYGVPFRKRLPSGELLIEKIKPDRPEYIEEVSKTFLNNGFISAVVAVEAKTLLTDYYPHMPINVKEQILPELANITPQAASELVSTLNQIKKTS